jgi:hypothetical protein
MNPPAVPAWTAFKDRKTGLVVFGFFTALLGVFCALFVPLLFFGQAISAKGGAPAQNVGIWPAALIYGVMAIVLVWLGIGSMMARRWAGALLLIFSWSWLVIGVTSTAVMGFVLPQMMEAMNSAKPPGGPPPPTALLVWIPMLTIGFIYLVLPTAWLLFYRRRHVKATCETYDPIVRWTDRAPLPVLAASLWLGLSGLMMLVMATAFKGVLPAFGVFVTGPLGSAIYVLYGVALGYSAWAIYRLDVRGWWIVMVSLCLWTVSAAVTYSRHDLSEVYSLMGYPEQQIQEMRKFTFVSGQGVVWTTVAVMLPMFGYLLYIRRFLTGSRERKLES